MIDKIKSVLEKSEDESLEFDTRYKVHRKKDGAHDWIKENEPIIDKLKKNKRAKSLDYFYEIFTSMNRLDQLKKEKRKRIGTICNLVPEELILAAGAIPLRLCSECNETIKTAEQVFPRDSCPVVKSTVGSSLMQDTFFSVCDAVVIPATCDGKKKMAEFINDYKTVWVLDLPQSKERTRTKKYWQSEIRVLKQRIEKLTGNRIGRNELQDAIKLVRKKQTLGRRLLKLRQDNVILGSDYLVVIQASFFDDINNWIENTQNLLEELNDMKKRKRLVKPRDATRILLTGSPVLLPNFKIVEAIESHNAIITMDETCAGSQHMYDTVEVDEPTMSGMMEAVSERYLMPSVCPCFIKSEDRIDKVLNLIEEYNIDGIVYHTLRLCLIFDIESIRMRDILTGKGHPFLLLNTDHSKEDLGQIQTRIEAFIEILRSR